MPQNARILSIDGGGIRGVIPACVLAQLEEDLGKPIYECFDLVCGTSTGGLIALALTTPRALDEGGFGPPMTAAEVLGLYLSGYDDIFVEQPDWNAPCATYYTPSTWVQSVLGSSTLSQAATAMQGLGGAVREAFATGYTMSGAASAQIGPYLFSWRGAQASAGDDYFVWEAALGTSAAPTYFPIVNVGAGSSNPYTDDGNSAPPSGGTNRWVCDGGVSSNDPSMHALARAKALGLCQGLDDVTVVSLGTGLYNAGVSPTNEYFDIDVTANWDAAYWADGFDNNGNPTYPILSVLGMSNQQVPEMQLAQLLPPSNYLRLEPCLDYELTPLDADDASELQDALGAYLASSEGAAAYKAILHALE